MNPNIQEKIGGLSNPFILCLSSVATICLQKCVVLKTLDVPHGTIFWPVQLWSAITSEQVELVKATLDPGDRAASFEVGRANLLRRCKIVLG